MNTTIPKRIAVIMAGGSGERFWPLSRCLRPKQFLYLTGDTQTLLERCISNISPVFSPERIILATGKPLVEIIRNTHTDIPPENILAEPYKRNTSGCLIFAAANLLARYGGDGTDITMAVLPADHNIGDPGKFRSIVHYAMKAAEEKNALITLGVKPNRPETGYGYIEIAPDDEPAAMINDDISVFPVVRFLEKPDLTTAEKYIATDRFFWNSGMFFWRLSTFMDELGTSAPDMLKALERMTEALAAGDEQRVAAVFEKLDNISIDYALMEKANQVFVIKADFDWDDMGSWDAIERTLPKDKRGNVSVGGPVLIDSQNCIVYNEPGAEDKAVAIVGVEDLAVIVSEDAVLVVPKERAQDVRNAVEELRRRNAPQL